jgi:hypothetical protein
VEVGFGSGGFSSVGIDSGGGFSLVDRVVAMVLGITIGTTVVSVRVSVLGCVILKVIVDDPDTVVE